jgi:hypothetical protein
VGRPNPQARHLDRSAAQWRDPCIPARQELAEYTATTDLKRHLISLLYIVTGFILAAQTYWLLMWAIWGAPTNASESLALLGSLILFVSGIIHIWKPLRALYVIAVSEILIWCFYLPAIFVTIRQSIDPTSTATFTPGTLFAVLVVYALLILSTAITSRKLISKRRGRRVN